MKTIFITLVVLGFSEFSFSEELQIAKSPFWQTPYLSKIKIQISSQDTSLENECATYKKQIYAADGSLNFTSKENLDFIRQLPAQNSMDTDFSAYFLLGKTQGFETTAELPSPSKIPFFNQNNSLTDIDAFSLNTFTFVYDAKSFLAASLSVGLKPLTVSVVNLKGLAAVKVIGRDAVCDLLDQKAIIQAKAIGNVHLPLNTQVTQNEYYSMIETQVMNVLSLNESAIAKTVRLGFRLSQVVSPSTVGYSKEKEDAVLALFRVLFNENSLDLTGAWSRGLGKPVLNTVGTQVRVPLQISLGK